MSRLVRTIVVVKGAPQSGLVSRRLADMQALVGGYVEHVMLRGKFAGLHLWCNEMGRLDGLPLHETPFYPEPIAGDFFLTRLDAEGEMADLTDTDVDLIWRHYR